MTGIERAAIGWDRVNWGRALEEWERAGLADCRGWSVLELGCGKSSGGLGLWFAARGAEVVASSVADVEEELRAVYGSFDLLERFRFERIDALDIPHEEEFDAICFKSMLGAIGRDGERDRQRQAVESIRRALRPGGRVFLIENLAGSVAHGWLRNRWGAGRNRWRYFEPGELGNLFGDGGLVRENRGSTGFLGALGRTETQRDWLGTVDRWVAPAVSEKWHYVGWGVWRRDNGGGQSPPVPAQES